MEQLEARSAPRRWGEKPYRSLDYHIRSTFGEKLYKISLDAGMSCPNRDGTLGTGGCIFCSRGGSATLPQTVPVRHRADPDRQAPGAGKFKGTGYIAYFQAYTTPTPRRRRSAASSWKRQNTRYPGSLHRHEAGLPGPGSAGSAGQVRRVRPVWVELGLQTVHPGTAAFIRRGYELPVFERAIRDLRSLGLDVIVQVILFLPGETPDDMYATVDYLNRMDIQGVKLQLLHVLRGTDLAAYYEAHPFHIPAMEEYFHVLGECLLRLRPDITVHRLTGDGPKQLLVAPLWTGNKRRC